MRIEKSWNERNRTRGKSINGTGTTCAVVCCSGKPIFGINNKTR
jgi:hypothetical protein